MSVFEDTQKTHLRNCPHRPFFAHYWRMMKQAIARVLPGLRTAKNHCLEGEGGAHRTWLWPHVPAFLSLNRLNQENPVIQSWDQFLCPSHLGHSKRSIRQAPHFACLVQKAGSSLSVLRTQVTSVVLPLCDPMDWSPPGSSARGVLQARILEWVAMPSSRGSS